MPERHSGEDETAAPWGGTYSIGRRLFLRALGLVYLIAFLSLWVQIEGLVGSDGILPIADYLDRIRENTGVDRYWRLPTLLWLADGDTALHLLSGAGVLLSLALIGGLAPRAVLFGLWACYLSLVYAGQTFLGFQWDSLLLETGFCALFVAPPGWRPRSPSALAPPSRAGLWLLWLLLFKLMFLSGVVKPLSMDETWWKLTALDYHYWTQPIPNGISWYAHRLPGWFQKFSTLVTYAIEIGLPFLIFAGRVGRRLVALGTVFLMLMISWTGNFGFFNLLTIVLCIPLVDDAIYPRRLVSTPAPRPAPTVRRRIVRAMAVVCVVLLVAVSGLTTLQEMARTVPPNTAGTAGELAELTRQKVLSWAEPEVLSRTAPFRTINGYGLFRSMTVERPEIVVEGSDDGVAWTPYAFKWKPGDPARRPPFVAPHMPRLDWQMWFAALNPRRAQHWLSGLIHGLLRGSPDVVGLLEDNPFDEAPPRYVRLLVYRYRFATPAERREGGVWWTRELSGPLTPPLDLKQFEP
jgi:hypothetical protein